MLIEQWRAHYNTIRPHSAFGYRPPAPEAVIAYVSGGLPNVLGVTQDQVATLEGRSGKVVSSAACPAAASRFKGYSVDGRHAAESGLREAVRAPGGRRDRGSVRRIRE